MHIFTHHRFAYPFEIKDDTDWMSRYFFTGGQMPSHNLFLYFQKDFQIQNQWAINGTHYANTSETWLSRMYQNKTEIINIFMDVYGDKYALKWFVYWKVFLWLVRNFGNTREVRNGLFHIIYFRNVKLDFLL